MTYLTADKLRWHHAGTAIFTIARDYTITDTIIANPNGENRYHVFAQIDGDEVHLESYPTISDVLDYLNKVAA